jgi:hypothetical protein
VEVKTFHSASRKLSLIWWRQFITCRYISRDIA